MGSESQSEAVSEHSGDPGEGQGGGKDRPALYVLPCGWHLEINKNGFVKSKWLLVRYPENGNL